MGEKNVFTIAQAEKFPLELGRMPKKVQKAYLRTILPILGKTPDQPDPPRIKRLNGYKALWRMRVSDNYRLVYRVDRAELCVTMLMIDHRAKIYDRLGAKVWNLYFLVPTGRGQFVSDISPVEYDDVLEELSRIQLRYQGKMIVNAKCAPHYVKHLFETDPS